jgi:hypothetical protein
LIEAFHASFLLPLRLSALARHYRTIGGDEVVQDFSIGRRWVTATQNGDRSRQGRAALMSKGRRQAGDLLSALLYNPAAPERMGGGTFKRVRSCSEATDSEGEASKRDQRASPAFSTAGGVRAAKSELRHHFGESSRVFELKTMGSIFSFNPLRTNSQFDRIAVAIAAQIETL